MEKLIREKWDSANYGVRIVSHCGLDVLLCSECFDRLLIQCGGWDHVDRGKVIPLTENHSRSFCDLCNDKLHQDPFMENPNILRQFYRDSR